MRKDAMKAALDVAMPRFDDTSTTSQRVSSLLGWACSSAIPVCAFFWRCVGDERSQAHALQVVEETPCQRKETKRRCREEEVSDGNRTGKGERTKKTCTRRCENNKVVTSKASNHSNIYSRGPANKLTWVLVRIEGEAGDVSPASNVQLESIVSVPGNRPYEGQIPHLEHINTTSGSAPYACACN